MDSDCMLYFATNSECIFIRDFIENNDLMVVLTHYSECMFIAHRHRRGGEHVVLTHYSESMFISRFLEPNSSMLYLPTIQNACSSLSQQTAVRLSCTYPLFRMHVHHQISIILYNRHLLNVRALLFLLLYI